MEIRFHGPNFACMCDELFMIENDLKQFCIKIFYSQIRASVASLKFAKFMDTWADFLFQQFFIVVALSNLF